MRASHYATYQVLPSCYEARVSEQFAEITKKNDEPASREKGWSRQEIMACWNYVKNYLVTINQWKWHSLREFDRIKMIEDYPVRLRVAEVKYEEEGEGFLFDEDYVEMSKIFP